MKIRRSPIFFLTLFCLTSSNHAQTLLELTEKNLTDTTFYTQSTFKSTRISIGQSVETRDHGVVEFHVMNRFWNTPEPRTQNFAADRMSTRVGVEYAFTDRFTAGLGGTTWDGIFDTFLKYRLIRQEINKGGKALSITLFQNAAYRSEAADPIHKLDSFSDRFSFTTQLLFARKFTTNFSLQLSPTLIHRNAVRAEENPTTQFATGFGARYRVGHHVSIVSEYYYVFNPLETVDTYGPFSLGVNWEAGDLILQFQLTNAKAMNEESFISRTTTNFNTYDGNLHFGFGATYVLHTRKNN